MLATDKTKLGLHINQKSSTDKCRTTFTYLVIFGKWTETSQLSNTGYERQASVLDLKDCITAITSVQSVSPVLCKQFTSNYANSSEVFTPHFLPCSDLKLTPGGLSTSHTLHVTHQEQLLGEKISINLQAPVARTDRQMWRVADWLGFIINIHHLHIYPISLVNSLGSLAELKTQCFTTMWTIESCKSWLYNRNGYSIQESCLVFFVLLLLTFLND